MSARGESGDGGRPLGVLLLEGKMAAVPGCMACRESWPYPVLYKVVRGSRPPASPEDVEALRPLYVTAARELEAEGAGVITDNCNGLMVLLQPHLAAAVGVPVVTSALLAVPALAAMVPGRRIGILTFFAQALGEWHYQACGWSSDRIPVAVGGVGEQEPWLTFLRTKEAPEERARQMAAGLVAAAREMVEEHPDVAAFVSECTLLPPASEAVRRQLGLPVYDILTLLDLAMAGHRRPADLGLAAARRVLSP